MRLAALIFALVLVIPLPCLAQTAEHRLVDETGQAWTSHDPVWLAEWVRQRNVQARARVAASAKAEAPQANFGVSYDHFPLSVGSKKWGAVGEEAPVKPDVFLTVVGKTEAEASKVVDAWRHNTDFASLESGLGMKLAVNAYAKGNPIIKNLKIEANGSPDVVIQKATGEVLFRDFSDPGSEVIVGELRRADPNYEPGSAHTQARDHLGWETLIAVALFAFTGTSMLVLTLFFARKTHK